jgi:hypothetical protein
VREAAEGCPAESASTRLRDVDADGRRLDAAFGFERCAGIGVIVPAIATTPERASQDICESGSEILDAIGQEYPANKVGTATDESAGRREPERVLEWH